MDDYSLRRGSDSNNWLDQKCLGCHFTAFLKKLLLCKSIIVSFSMWYSDWICDSDWLSCLIPACFCSFLELFDWHYTRIFTRAMHFHLHISYSYLTSCTTSAQMFFIFHTRTRTWWCFCTCSTSSSGYRLFLRNKAEANKKFFFPFKASFEKCML